MNVVQIVNQKIIEQLQQGVIPWTKPWIGPHGAYSFNSGKPYSVMNQMLLSLPGAYATYDQWEKHGGQVRRGEKGHFVVFWKIQENRIIDENGNEKVESRPVLRYYRIFHSSQVDGISIDSEVRAPLPPDPIEAAETLISTYISREKLSYQEDTMSNQAYYSPQKDQVVIPDRSLFKSSSGLYGTIFHELAHSTGAENRLNRPGAKNISFGSREYAQEELIAELTSSYLLESLGICTDDSTKNTASYLYSWIQAIQENETLIIRSAPAAERAARFIIGS